MKLQVAARTCAMTFFLVLPIAESTNALELPEDISFEVWMDDKRLGTHHYHFSEYGDLLQVDSKAQFNVKIMFVNVFKYEHHAVEHWQGYCLRAVRSGTTTNGKEEALEREFDRQDCPGTYSYWDKARLQRTELTNAQTGEKETATWQDLPSTPLPAPSKKAVLAHTPTGMTHHQLTTPSATFLLWYDKTGRCLSMQTTNDGRTITYINRQAL